MKDKLSNAIFIFVAFISGGLTMYYFSNNNINNTNNLNDINLNYGDTSNLKDKFIESDELEDKTCNDEAMSIENNLVDAIGKVYDATVMVNTYKSNKVENTGSGFVYKVDDKYAYIMTNHHVIDEGNKWSVILTDDTEVDVMVLGSDAYLDLAVLKMDKSYVKSIAKIGSDSKCKLGDTVFSVGSPLGYEYRGSVTNGIISGLKRMVEVAINSSSEDYVMEVIQTNAAVNPGNSGGPLVNANGEVIGVVSLKLVQNSVEGMGFAIPIDYAMKFIPMLEKGEKIERPLLGISMVNVNEKTTLKRYHNIVVDSKIEKGVVVIEIDEKSSVKNTSLQKGDVITKINDDDIENAAYLKYYLYQYKTGDTIELTYYRDGVYKTTKITLMKNN